MTRPEPAGVPASRAGRAKVVRFRISRAAQLMIVVRGPGPGCEVVARLDVLAEAGQNRLRINGPDPVARLAPGTYRLDFLLRGRTSSSAQTFVRIAHREGAKAVQTRPQCTPLSGTFGDDGSALLSSDSQTAINSPRPVSMPDTGVLGAANARDGLLPPLSEAAPVGGSRDLVRLAAIALLVGGALGLTAIAATRRRGALG